MNSRAKGKTGELNLAKFLRSFGFNVRRGVQYSGINGDADLVGIDGMHIECKYTKNGHGNTYEWLEQARRDAKEGEVPTVWHKKVSKQDRGNRWLVTLTAEDFIALWQKK